MAKYVGMVSKVIGQVFAVASDGSRRPLIEGDRLFVGEQLETGAVGAVAVRLQNGAELTLGRDSSVEMTSDLLANRAHHAPAHDVAPSDAQLSDVERIQQAIAAGDDPTQSAEATAAGSGSPSVSGALGGGHSFVILEEVGARVDPVVGFPTAGFNGFPELANREVGGLDSGNGSTLNGRPVGGDNGNGGTGPTEPTIPTVDENHPVTLLGLNIAPGELSLNEANLPLGSASDAVALTQQGRFTVVAQDGVFNLSVGGINVVTGGVVSGVGQSITTGLGNILTITAYNPHTGEVSYSYTLTASGQHIENDGTKSLTEHLQVLVSDSDGDVAQGSLDVIIHDDAPQAFDDGNAVTATEQHVELTGNVLSNDVQGADRVAGGPVIAGTYTGTYGTLVLAADGSYTYSLNPNAPDFKNLGGGGNGVEHFTYTIKDADGDTSTATLTLNVSNLNDPVTLNGLDVQNGELTVYEKNLSDGTAPDANALTQQGTFKVTAADGLQSLTVGGIAVVTGGVAAGFPQSVVTPEGNTLTITGYNPTTGVVSYSYTLTDNGNHPDGAGTNSISEHFDVVAKDVDGSTATGSLDVSIVDDVPKAVDDSNVVMATEQHVELTGNVLTNDAQGADRVAGGPVIAGTYTGTYGTLVLAADGSYTYTLNPDAPDFKNLGGGGEGVEHFTYTIKDADGDTSTATLTLNISNLNDPVTLDGMDVQNGELTVYEKNLSDGTSPDANALTQQGTFKVTAADGLQTLTVGGIAVVTGGVATGFPQSVVTPEGNTLTITGYNPTTGVVSYSYTLTDNGSHPDGAGTNSISEHFDVVAKDVDGSTATGSLDVNIVDDVPKAVDDSNVVTATEQHGELTGNVLSNDIQGADRVAGGPVVAGTYTGTYGTLVLAADGSYTYTLNPDAPDFKNLGGGGNGVEHFTYKIKDADGDTSTATLTLNISNLNDPVTLDGMDVQNGELTVYEKNLSDGTSPDANALTQQGTFKVTAADGLQTLTVGGIAVVTGGVAVGFPQSVITPQGNILTITGYNPSTGVVSYSYTLTDNGNHPDGAGTNSISEHFDVVAKDVDGSTATGSLDVNIVDDVPQASADTTSVVEGGTATGNVLWNDKLGADQAGTSNVVVGARAGSDTSTLAIGNLNTAIVGQYGTLTIDAAGNAVYHANPNAVLPQGASDVFVYTVRDTDGDESTTTITINVQDCSLVAGPVGGVMVHESALDTHQDGNDLAAGSVTGSDPNSTRETASGSLAGSASGGVGALTYSLVGDATGQYGQLHLNADGSYTYTLTTPANSPTHANDGPNSVTETFTYQVKDSVGNSTTSTLVITIVDDVPQAHSDYTSVYKGDVVRGNVMYNDVVGADVRTDGNYVVGVRAGSDTSTSAIGQLNTQVNGQYGYLTIDEKGNAVYHSNPDVVSPRDAVDTFVYTIRDADGDESTTTITINVHNSLMACADRDVTVYENALDLHKDGNDLAAGSVTGSDPNSTRETASGSLAGSASGGVGALTYSLVGDATGQYGQLHLNADGSYTYTLTSPANSPTHANDGPNTVTETFTYQVKDSVGNSTTSTILITIVDDVPQAHSDYTSVYKGDEVRGNVMYNDVVGADVRGDGNYVVGVRAGSDTSTSAIGQLNTQVNGQYGYLTIDEKGNAVYHSNPDVVSPRDAVDTFVYTIRDADGDESTTTITINVHDPRIEVCMDSGVTVFEKALDLSKDGSDLAAGTVTGSNPTSPLETASGSLVGLASGGIGALSYSLVGNAVGQYGQIQLNADGSYTYTLTSPANSPTHANDGANTVTESFTYQVQDAYGHSATSTIVISIVDDVPQAHCDFVSVYKGDEVRGNVMYNDVVGADVRSDGNYVVGIRAGNDTSTSAIGQLNTQVNGQYGYLTIDEKGNAVYHSNPDVVSPRDAVDTFVYTIRDADGDESTTTLTINVHDATLVACGDRDVTVYEKALDLHKDGNDLAAGTSTGSDPASSGETASGSLVGSVSRGVGALTYSLVGNAVGQYGQISVNPDGSYTYTLTSPANTPGADSAVDHFTYKATDSLGHSITGNIAITVVDDVPNAVCAERSITPGKLDSNILLLIDVSGSMDCASGIPGLTRLDAAKHAIAALLDKYDGMGDIKVQIVTFSGGAQIQSAEWVSIEVAKSIVSGLHAGGSTYYDSAATAAQTAFDQNGKLAGAQNVSYFFSDGEPSSGHAMTASRETSWETFLDSHGIKSYAIGLGQDVNAGNLDPLAYDGSSHTDTNAVIVNDFNQLYGVLSGTVQGSPITGSLLSDGTFGADGGFIKALLVDGTTYTYDPKANAGQGGYLASGGADHASFDTQANTLTIKTSLGGSLVVNMDSGEFTYAPPTVNDSSPPERIGFMVSDNDGDTSTADLLIMINGNHAPVAVADHVITNITGASITLPSEVLLANDSDADNDRLSATPITVDTHFADKGAGFTLGNTVPNITFDGQGNTLDNQFKALDRSAFTTAAGSMTAALVVLGYLGSINGSSANSEDVITVSLRKGETLQLGHDRPEGNVSLEWKDANGSYQPIADGGSFTASHDGVYSIHVVNQANPSDSSRDAESYKLSLVVDYSNAENEVHQASYTVTDGHGGSTVGAVDITYHAGTELNGTAGNDVMMASNVDTVLNGGDGHDVLVGGGGNDTLHGGNGNDLLIGGLGNDLLDGGAGNDTASYASATGAVTVDLSHIGPQDTGAAGIDTLTGIENLIGSDYNDTLIGDAGDNLLNGGLGNDVLKGGDGNDILIGGPGNDIMTGGNGNDAFVWQKGDTGHDTVTDFTPGSDHLDLSQLLQGENATAASLDDYLHFKVSGSGTNVVSTIEVSSVAGAAPTQTIDLAGVDLAQHYGVTAGAGGVVSAGQDTATIINGMINDHSLKVDTV
ncbi:retention module-containing protein [Pseudomonas sp. NPDC086566]|uniref:retention module-containing protein n=1 Tax=Pseudomonas sp. NPDC086566 TaxID=3390647 RepID=UPI003D068218